MQKRLLKRFIEKQVCRLRQLSEAEENGGGQPIEGQIETFNELLSAHKELIELSNEHADRFAFLSQASRLMDQALQLSLQASNMMSRNEEQKMSFCEDDEVDEQINLDFLKWMISFSWN